MINHLSEEQVNDLLDAKLSPAVETESRSHLAECAGCMESANRTAAVIAAALEVRLAVQPSENLWPAIARKTIYLEQSVWRRNPWIYTVILTAVFFTALTVWMIVARPWERLARQRPGSVAVAASSTSVADARRELATLRSMSNTDASKIRSLRKLVRVVAGDPAQRLWTDFFAVVETIESAGDRRKVLLDVVPFTTGKPQVAEKILASAEPMLSSANKMDVLVALAKTGSVSTPALRERYLDVTMSISSPKNRARAEEALKQE